MTAQAAQTQTVDYNRDIRPILSDNCYHCHGPDATTRKADLRLDTPEGAFTDLGGYTAIERGDAEASELFQRLIHDDPQERMPPRKSKKTLTAEQIQLFKQWINEGADVEQHWSFLPPQRSELPETQQTDWATNGIDHFVLKRLEDEGLQPSSPADKPTLIRRATLDLTGLPPTPDEVEAYVADERPDAYERLVDRLLDSPGFGERMAVNWLEAARYADTDGYQNDGPRDVWRWRDWVVEAYNRNLPFDEFTVEQLAGDMLPNATLDQHIATAFNRHHRINSEGGVIPEEFIVEYSVDRVETMGTIWLGMSMGCARCHEHKYDPFTQKEFYQLYAYFNNIPEEGRAVKFGNSEPYILAPTRPQQEKIAQLDADIRATHRRTADLEKPIARQQADWESRLSAEPIPSSVTAGLTDHYPLDGELGNLANAKAETKSNDTDRNFQPAVFGPGLDLNGQTDVDLGPAGFLEINKPYTVSVWVYPRSTDNGTVLARLNDSQTSAGYELRFEDNRVRATFITRWITGVTGVKTRQPLEPNRWHHILWTSDESMSARGMHVFVNGVEHEVDITYNSGSNFTKPGANTPLLLGSRKGKDRFDGLIDEVRFYDRVLRPEEITILAQADTPQQIAAIPRNQRTPEQAAKIRHDFLYGEGIKRSNKINQALAALDKARKAKTVFIAKVPQVMVMKELETPRPAYILNRGVWNQPGEEVQPAVPDVFASFTDKQPTNRLELARWLMSPNHPLTARVTVNRYWQMFFGRGLVKTAEDFGSQGTPPSHPELLDWLATEFVALDWDIKAMLKRIVTSSTYKQSSRTSPELLERDPENVLYARGPRFRLPAYAIRDQALAFAGLLSPQLGGPPVMPYQPEGLWRELSGTQKYVQARGEDLYRRSLYTYWKRTIAPPTMAVFDTPQREACAVLQTRTNTPIQALTLLNDPTFVEASRVLGQRMLTEGGASPEDRIGFAFRIVTARTPRQGELRILKGAYDQVLADFTANPSNARRLLTVGDSKPDASLDPVRLATQATVASMIMNLDETITKE
ncbi:MAG: DUF1553 domain-containing protein [Planctomycetota bacterium]